MPAPLVRARYKEEPDDFEVEEIPAYEPSGSGDHLWLWLEKRGISTIDAVRHLARILGRREREFGYAGLKDAQALTRQWISIEHQDPGALDGLRLPHAAILRVTRHGNKLRAGHLHGNRFQIRLRGVDAAGLAALRANLEWLCSHGAPNGFGEQRFGKRGANLDKGLEILAHPDPGRIAAKMPRPVFRLLVSAVQSEVFNRVLAARIDRIDRILAGDVAWLHHNGACFRVEDPAREQPRCDAFEISPSGPLPGPHLLEAHGEPGEIEAAAMAALGVSKDSFAHLPTQSHPGVRRPLRVPVRDASVDADPHGARVTFALPAGSYATAVLRELIADMPWFGGAGTRPAPGSAQEPESLGPGTAPAETGGDG